MSKELKKYFYQGFKEPVYLEKVETTKYGDFRFYYLTYRGEKIYVTHDFNNRLPYSTNIQHLRYDVEREMIEVDRKLDKPKSDFEEENSNDCLEKLIDLLENGWEENENYK